MVRILLADGYAVVRRSLRALIETRSDLQVCAETDDGHDAVALALAQKPDVAVIDVTLPGLNGIEVTRQIRKGLPAIEVLIVSMHDSEELFIELLQAGARGFLLKEDAGRQIIDAIVALAQHRPFFSERAAEALRNRLHAPTGLTAGEREIVQLIAEGQSNSRTAQALNLNARTAETHGSGDAQARHPLGATRPLSGPQQDGSAVTAGLHQWLARAPAITTDDMRQFARECLKWAEQTDNPSDRHLIMRTSRMWMEAAASIDRKASQAGIGVLPDIRSKLD